MIYGPNKLPLRRVIGFARDPEWREDPVEASITGGSMREPAQHQPPELGGGDQWRTPPYAGRKQADD